MPGLPETPENIAADFVKSAAHSAVQMPYDGIRQLVNEGSQKALGKDVLPEINIIAAPQEAEFGTARWHSQQIGAGVGMAVPMFLMTKVCGAKMFGPPSGSLLAETGKAAMVGAGFDFVFRPTHDGADFWHERMQNAALGALTMGTMAGSGGIISRAWARTSGAAVPELAYSLSHQVLNGTASGGLGGFVHSEADSLWKTGKLAAKEDVLKSMYGFAFTGGTMAGLHRGADRLSERSKFSTDKYFSANPVLGVSDGIKSPLLDLLAQEKIRPEAVKDAKALRAIAEDGVPGWNREEQARAFAELKRNAAGSRFASEQALEDFVRILNKNANHLTNPELAKMAEEDRVLSKASMNAEQNLHDVTVASEETRLAGTQKLMDPEFQKAHPQYKEALEARDATRKEWDAHRKIFEAQKTKAEVNAQFAINEFVRNRGLPPLRVVFDDAMEVAGYGFGNREMRIGYANSAGFSARQAEVLLHELVHYEQDILRLRLRADRMGIGKEATAEQKAEFLKAERAITGTCDEKFFDEVIRARKGQVLSVEEAARAEQVRLDDDPFNLYVSEGGRYQQLRKELASLESKDGALLLAQRLANTHEFHPYRAERLLGDQHSLVQAMLRQLEGSTEGQAAPLGWDEAANKQLLKHVMEQQAVKADAGIFKNFFDYVRQTHELEAYSVGLLANLKAKALGVK